MRFVDDNDYGGDGDDDVSPRNNLGEIPRVVVLMKRMKWLEPGDRETQRSMDLKKEQRGQQTGWKNESMNKRGQNREIPAQNMKHARLHSIHREQWALSFLLHPCFCFPLILFLRSRLVVPIVLPERKNSTLSVLPAWYSDGTPSVQCSYRPVGDW